MNKARNTLLFIVCGTVANLLLLLLFAVVFAAAAWALAAVTGIALQLIFPYGLILALISSMLVYQKLVKWVVARYNLTDKLGPLFGGRGKARRD